MTDEITFATMPAYSIEQPTMNFRWLVPPKSVGGGLARRLQQQFHVETFGGPDGGGHSFRWRDVPTVTEGDAA